MNKEIPGTKIRLYNPAGAGTIYHIMVGQFYNGQVCKMLGGWRIFLNGKSAVTKEQEVSILKTLESSGPPELVKKVLHSK